MPKFSFLTELVFIIFDLKEANVLFASINFLLNITTPKFISRVKRQWNYKNVCFYISHKLFNFDRYDLPIFVFLYFTFIFLAPTVLVKITVRDEITYISKYQPIYIFLTSLIEIKKILSNGVNFLSMVF